MNNQGTYASILERRVGEKLNGNISEEMLDVFERIENGPRIHNYWKDGAEEYQTWGHVDFLRQPPAVSAGEPGENTGLWVLRTIIRIRTGCLEVAVNPVTRVTAIYSLARIVYWLHQYAHWPGPQTGHAMESTWNLSNGVQTCFELAMGGINWNLLAAFPAERQLINMGVYEHELAVKGALQKLVLHFTNEHSGMSSSSKIREFQSIIRNMRRETDDLNYRDVCQPS